MEAADFAGSVSGYKRYTVKCDFYGYAVGHPANMDSIVLPHREITAAIVHVCGSNFPISGKNVKAPVKNHGTVLKNGNFVVVRGFHA
jgi:hypothetical protein